MTNPSLFSFLLNDSFYKLLYNFFFIVSTLMFGSCVSIIIVSSCVYNYKDLDDDDKEKELSLYDKTCYYEIKYLKEFRELEEHELTKDDIKTLCTKKVEDETPMGKIILTYNSETESFWYYCDTKTLTYKTLDAVARLFSIKHNCKQICVDYQKEWEESRQALLKLKEEEAEREDEEDEEEDEDEEEENKYSVFAKFKSYNITGNRAKTENTSESNKMYIHTHKSNRFSYKGKCSDYIDTTIIKKSSDSNSNLSFADFKKLKVLTDSSKMECCET